MISIVQHGLSASGLMGSRSAALGERLAPGLLAGLDLDSPSVPLPVREVLVGEPRLLLAGVVGETREIRGGRRQILALRLPGDLLQASDGDALVALTRIRVGDAAGLLASLSDRAPAWQSLRRVWLANARAERAMMRDQVVRLGRLTAYERTGHFLLETHERLAQVGLADNDTFHLPLTQETLSDVIGLSVVHLNRTLQALRASKLIITRQGCVTLSDRPGLMAATGYESRFPTPWAPRVADEVGERRRRQAYG